VNAKQVTVIGSYLSPYVRKVLVCLGIKGIAYEIDPIIPYFGNDDFTRISPLRRIPVLIDQQVTLADSTAICEYLDEAYDGPPLLPAGPALRARARWLEEFADSRMGDVFIWRYYNQLVIRKRIWKRPPDEAVLEKAVTEEIPAILDYLEAQLDGAKYLFGDISTADIAIASFFRNAHFAGFELDEKQWPQTAAFVSHVFAHPEFAELRVYEDLMMSVPIEERREALTKAGAPLTRETMATSSPRPGYFYT
jgi:glutathione S-transferase